MKTRSIAALVAAAALLASCSSAPKPKTLSGKNRQPINTTMIQPVVQPAPPSVKTLEGGNAVSSATGAPCEPCSTPPASTLAETSDGPQEAIEELVRVFRFQFPFGGTQLEIPSDVAPELLRLARSAKTIHLRGRTDGPAYSAGDEQVALKRALSARSYLVGHGVDATRVQLDYVSGADYLADNSTTEGRNRNRRVEIELQFFDEAAPALASTWNPAH